MKRQAIRGDAYTMAAIIRRASSRPDLIMRIICHGSVAKHDCGRDLDLIIEVPREVFDAYVYDCTQKKGIWPFGIAAVENSSDLFWSYFSPEWIRSEAALEAVGVSRSSVESESLLGEIGLDIICLPVGWTQSDSEVRKQLDKAHEGTRDPNFLRNVQNCMLVIE